MELSYIIQIQDRGASDDYRCTYRTVVTDDPEIVNQIEAECEASGLRTTIDRADDIIQARRWVRSLR